MNVLWVVNVELMQLKKAKGLEQKGTEGWLEVPAKDVARDNNLTVLYPGNSEEKNNGENIVFQSFQRVGKKNLNITIEQFREYIRSINPDVIHIWGTEYLHSYAMVKAAEKEKRLPNTIISVQGLVTYCAQQYLAGLPYDVQKAKTIRDYIKRDSLMKQRKEMQKQGIYEKRIIELAENVIGRTNWDYTCCKLFNNDITYYYCAETLREKFLNYRWEYDKCNKHQLFLAQGYYPLKGLHFLIEAINMLQNQYPDITLHIAGYDNAFKNGIKQTAYGKYLRKLINSYHLENKIKYVGLLTEEEMLREYLSAEIAISSSTIENSSNSVAEAMMLGMPVVASNVGGTPDMLSDGQEGLIYQWNSPMMLAASIHRFLVSRDLEEKMGKCARNTAVKRHNRETNSRELIRIYQKLRENYATQEQLGLD